MRALVRTGLLDSQLGQMSSQSAALIAAEFARRGSAFRLVGLGNFSTSCCTTGPGSLAAFPSRIDSVVDRVDLLGDGFQVDLAGAAS